MSCLGISKSDAKESGVFTSLVSSSLSVGGTGDDIDSFTGAKSLITLRNSGVDLILTGLFRFLFG